MSISCHCGSRNHFSCQMYCHEDSCNHKEQPKPISRQKYSYKMYNAQSQRIWKIWISKLFDTFWSFFVHFAGCSAQALRSRASPWRLRMMAPMACRTATRKAANGEGNQWVDKPRGAMIFLWLFDFFAFCAKSANEMDEIVSHWFKMLWRSVNEKRWRADWLSYIELRLISYFAVTRLFFRMSLRGRSASGMLEETSKKHKGTISGVVSGGLRSTGKKLGGTSYPQHRQPLIATRIPIRIYRYP